MPDGRSMFDRSCRGRRACCAEACVFAEGTTDKMADKYLLLMIDHFPMAWVAFVSVERGAGRRSKSRTELWKLPVRWWCKLWSKVCPLRIKEEPRFFSTSLSGGVQRKSAIALLPAGLRRVEITFEPVAA
ncbi:MAG: hypothetical protein ACYTBJ_08815 [Planctomycetota bacterium]